MHSGFQAIFFNSIRSWPYMINIYKYAACPDQEKCEIPDETCRTRKLRHAAAYAESLLSSGLANAIAGLVLPADIAAGKVRSRDVIRRLHGNVALNIFSAPFRGLPVKGCPFFKNLELPVHILNQLDEMPVMRQ
jgi:hypothetical protein